MKLETRKLERWLRVHQFTNEFAAYWWKKMQEADDKDAVALEMKRWHQATMKTMVETFRRLVKPCAKAARLLVDATWPLRYADDLADPEEDVFT